MTHPEAVSFISHAIHADRPEKWADFGCGSGTFSRALIELLPQGSHVTAVDRDNKRINIAGVDFVKADFEKDELDLSGLNGIMIANAIHYVADKTSLFRKLEKIFAGSPRFLIIEYDTDKANTWVPYPITFAQLRALFQDLGYQHINKVNERPSVYNSGQMYCAFIER